MAPALAALRGALVLLLLLALLLAALALAPARGPPPPPPRLGGGGGGRPVRGPKKPPSERFLRYRAWKYARPRLARAPLPPGAPRVRGRVALVVPYRDNPRQGRAAQLGRFLEFFAGGGLGAREGPGFDVFVVEQSAGARFNRGLLLDAGFLAAEDAAARAGAPPYESVVVHDVDLLPDRAALAAYGARPDRPVHLSAPSVYGKYPSDVFLGGALALSPADFRRAGGFPTHVFGWGAEDDIFYDRLAAAGVAGVWDNARGRITEMPHPTSIGVPGEANPRHWEDHMGDAGRGGAAVSGLPCLGGLLGGPRVRVRRAGPPAHVRVLVDVPPGADAPGADIFCARE
jgi:hypothetical protein